jgi:hypothetical protein
VAVLTSLVCLAGCGSAGRPLGFQTRARGDAPLERLAFWHAIADAPVAGNDDAVHGLLLFLDGRDASPDYPARLAALRSRGLLPGGFDAPGGAPVRRGTIAYALAKALDVKGGLTTRLFGMTPRYAVKELEFLGIFPPSSPNMVLSGNEFVGLISKAQDYRDTGSADPSAVASGPAGHTPAPPPSASAAPAWLDGAAGPQGLTLVNPILATTAGADAPSTSPTRTTAPATTGPVPESAFQAIVEEIAGDAQWRPADDAEWRLLKLGDVLGEQASVETGAAARVVLRMPFGQSLVIYQLTEVALLEVRGRGGMIKTDIGMGHGRSEYEILGAGVRYDSKIRGPNTTLAVRTTRVLLYDQPPFTSEAVSLIGRAEFFRKARGDSVYLGSGRAGRVAVRADRASAAETALEQSVTDPTIAAARTPSEEALVANLISRGATLAFDPIASINVLTGGDPPKTVPDITRTLPGPLTFVLTWDQAAGSLRVANMDILVASRSGEILFPSSAFASSKAGGRVPFDHRGGANGGIEYAYFTGRIPAELFYVSAVPARGAADVTLRAFLDGKPLQITDDSLPSPIGTTSEVRGRAGPDADEVIFGFVNPTLFPAPSPGAGAAPARRSRAARAAAAAPAPPAAASPGRRPK